MTAVLAQSLHRPPGTVGAAMITGVKLTAADATVADLRRFFADDHVHAAVVVAAGVLLAVVDRADLADLADLDNMAGFADDARAADVGRLGDRVVTPDVGLAAARRLLLASGRRRLAVVADDGTLLGLLCLKRSRVGFCSDRDLQNRSCGGRAG